MKQFFVPAVLSVLLLPGTVPPGQADTLRVITHAELTVPDPVWDRSQISRNHGYMIYDTLFALDSMLRVRPQMVDSHTVSDDGLTWTFRLREGLLWHDGTPVTAGDCVASLRRWSRVSRVGQRLLAVIRRFEIHDAASFSIVLEQPYGLVLESLAFPGAITPFMMPARVAATPPDQQSRDYTGSGPFRFREGLWLPGERVVYDRFRDYRPREEAPSGLAGGKRAMVSRVEWLTVSGPRAAVGALLDGKADMIEALPHALLPLLREQPDIRIVRASPYGNSYFLRFNTLHPPFDNPLLRRAVLLAFRQEEFLRAGVPPAWSRPCKALFACGTPREFSGAMETVLNGDAAAARELLWLAGYDGEPVILLQAADIPVLAELAPVAEKFLIRAGFTVRTEPMDWDALLARRSRQASPGNGGWSAFITSWGAPDILDPVSKPFLDSSCQEAFDGWPCDQEIEALRDAFARATGTAERREVVRKLLARFVTAPSHVPLGQWYQPSAVRSGISGLVGAMVPVFWNIRKDGETPR